MNSTFETLFYFSNLFMTLSTFAFISNLEFQLKLKAFSFKRIAWYMIATLIGYQLQYVQMSCLVPYFIAGIFAGGIIASSTIAIENYLGKKLLSDFSALILINICYIFWVQLILCLTFVMLHFKEIKEYLKK